MSKMTPEETKLFILYLLQTYGWKYEKHLKIASNLNYDECWVSPSGRWHFELSDRVFTIYDAERSHAKTLVAKLNELEFSSTSIQWGIITINIANA